jgi:UDP-2,3-diacylglucosamine pyrophosphatase LpxH
MGLFTNRYDGPRVTGKITTIPASGRAIVVSDFHGHLGDFDALLLRSRIFERLAAGEDVYLVITGDVPDLERHRAIDDTVTEDGDVRIFDRLLEASTELGPRANRIVYLEGNHDFHILRIAREVGLFEAKRKNKAAPPLNRWDPIDASVLHEYFDHYRKLFGEDVFQNNVAPYDMIHRVQPRHLEFLAKQPMLAVLEGAATLVTHAGPPKMAGIPGKSLKKTIERSMREDLTSLSPEHYYATPYHQLLNNRFRAQDYSLSDVEEFLNVFDASLLLTGHTPHPYLVDFAERRPLAGCDFRDGLGLVGKKQVVLCTSFGAFDMSRKRYIELDLARPYRSVDDLRSGIEIQPLYPDARPLDGADETTQIIRGLAPKPLPEPEVPSLPFDPNAITRDE